MVIVPGWAKMFQFGIENNCILGFTTNLHHFYRNQHWILTPGHNPYISLLLLWWKKCCTNWEIQHPVIEWGIYNINVVVGFNFQPILELYANRQIGSWNPKGSGFQEIPNLNFQPPQKSTEKIVTIFHFHWT